MPKPPRSPRQNLLLRGLFFCLGLFFIALGFIGAFLPVMPTVPFLIVAAACFARSSPRFEAWLLDHPSFGPMLREWRARRAIPRRAKYFALAGCIMGFVTVHLLGLHNPLVSLIIAAGMIAAMIYVFSRPDA